MNTELIRIKKAAKSILRVDPCDITHSEFMRLRDNASDTAEKIETFINTEDSLDEDTLYGLSLLMQDLREVCRG